MPERLYPEAGSAEYGLAESSAGRWGGAMKHKPKQKWNYGVDKFLKLHRRLLCGLGSARQRIADSHDLFMIICPEHFANRENQQRWKRCQDAVIPHVRNFGTDRIPLYRLTIRNKTIEGVLLGVLEIHADICHAEWSC
jgi:hypothetical protein